MSRVVVRILEVHKTGCTVSVSKKIKDKVEEVIHYDVLIPYHGLMIGHEFEADMSPTADPKVSRFDNWNVRGRP